MLTIEPLFRDLKSIGLIYRVDRSTKVEALLVRIGHTGRHLSQEPKWPGCVFDHGTKNIVQEAVYLLDDEHWEKLVDPGCTISDAQFARIEGVLDSCYSWDEDHHVTEWKDD